MAGARVGFIGLGDQGGPMAQRIIAAGFPTTVWARRPEALAPFTAAGAAAAADPAALARASDLIGLCVRTDADLMEIYDQISPGLLPGAVVMIHSTVRPAACVALAERAAAKGVDLLDAPVSGGHAVAVNGRLTVMVGGDAGVLERCRPVLASFAQRIVHVGDAGAGQRAKLVNNLLMAANFTLAHEAVSTGVAMGLNRAALNDIIAASSGGSIAHKVYAGLPQLSDFARHVELVRKDVGLIAAERADDERVQRMAEVARRFLDAVDADANARGIQA